MGIEDWNWRHPVELQDVPWDCAAASLTWCLQACGRMYTESQIVSMMYPTYLSPTYGLLDASGAGIVEFLSTLGITALNDGLSSWADVTAAAGYQPMLIGGRYWNHWSGVRIGAEAYGRGERDLILLANPSPGWMGVQQWMVAAQFEDLGDFSAVWFTSW